MSRKKIVFIIDIRPALLESSDFDHEDNWRQIQFSILRLLTYFGGKHKSGGGKVGTGPLWGFKFYKSSGGHLEYGNHHFFDFKLKDFESFEEEFKVRIDQTRHEQSLTSPDVSSQLSCALAEVVAGFQWERPDFYSPIKAKKNDPNRKKQDIKNDAMNNHMFLFTPCPSCCGARYFSKKTTVTSSTCLKSLLMKEELYRKIVFESKISLHWIDTGQNEGQAQHFHKTLSETMTFFSGSLVPLKNLSYWWVQTENEATTSIKSCQPAPFSTFIDSILSKSANNYRRDTDTKLSIDVYNLALSLKGSFKTSESKSSSLFIPIILRNATMKSISRRNFPQNHMTVTSTVTQNASAEGVQTKEPGQQERTNKFDQQEKEPQCDSVQGNIAIIKSVFKTSAALHLLQDIQESYYCSYDQMNSDPRSIHLLAYKQLLKILKAKKLILVLQLNHPEGGHQVNACLQPWTNMSAVITIIAELAPLTSAAKEASDDLSAKHPTVLIEKLVDNIQKKLGLTKLARKGSDKDVKEEMNKVGKGPPTSSFMQSLDYWFYDLPSHAVNPSIHKNIQRIKGVDAETAQRANQRSSTLFGKLKKHYEQQQNARKAERSEDKTSKPKRPVISSPKMKSLAATRSEQLLVKSRAVKQKKKSEEEFKEKEKQKVTEEDDRKWKENNVANVEEEGCPFDDFDISKECQDLPSIKSEDFAQYMKKEITDVLQKDLDSGATVARRLSKNLVIYLHKMNQGKEIEEFTSPNGFLEDIFGEIASRCSSEQKSSKVSRHLLYVLMELEIAALLVVKDSKKSGKPENSDQGGHQTSKNAEDDEISSQMESITSPAKLDPKTDPGKSDREIDKSKSNAAKSGFNASESESDESNLELEKLKAIAERIVRQLRPVIFLEDPVFLAMFLNATILPRFKLRIPKILQEIYDRLGQETPNEIVTPSKRTSDGDESFETIIDHDHIDSVVFSDYGSNNPSNQSGVSLRRFSSISDNMASKRQIVVPLKKAKKSSKKKVKKGFKAENNMESDDEANGSKEGWCRNLFETGLDGNVLPVKGSKKRKLHRRYSEMAPAVKDTPAGKQKRHFFWKRQHKERRKTDGITDITVIGESPLKDCHIAESPIKTSGASRFLSRSQSFNCKTSPRRFYAFQRSRSILQASPRKPFGRSFSCLTESDKVLSIETPEKNHVTERSLNQLIKTSLDTSLDKTIANEKIESLDGESPILFATPRKSDGVSPGRTPLKREPTFLANDTPKKEDTQSVVTPRKRNSSLDSNLSKDEFTSIMDRTPQKRRRFSETTTSTGYSFYEDSSDTARPKPVLDLLDIASQSSSGGFDVRLSSKPVFYSEDSMDWVAMFENDQTNQVSHNKIDESPLPTMDSVPSLKGSENGSLIGNSPNLFTPIREGKQPFSSPFLSASSLETLENAPILSPRLRGSKSKRESTCRKRIEITSED